MGLQLGPWTAEARSARPHHPRSPSVRLPRRLTAPRPLLVAAALAGVLASLPTGASPQAEADSNATARPSASAAARAATSPATLAGNDVSWPQCSKREGGYDLPLPGLGTGFVVVGLTRGLPFQENPCLDRQLAHARALSAKLAVYSFAAYPTQIELDTAGMTGPYDAATRLGRLSNAGYAQGSWS